MPTSNPPVQVATLKPEAAQQIVLDAQAERGLAQTARDQAQGHASDASQDAAQTALDVIATGQARDLAETYAGIDHREATWGAMALIDGAAGDTGYVSDDDTGTHTDPITSETVPNAGVYRWADAGLGSAQAERIGSTGLAGKADLATVGPFPQNQRIAEFPRRSGFFAGELRGPELYDGTNQPALSFDIASGVLEVTGGASADTARYFWLGHNRNSGEAIVARVKVKRVNSVSGTSGVVRGIIAVGFGSETIQYTYNGNGNLSVVGAGSDNNNLSVLTTTSGDGGLVLTEGETGTLTLVVGPDNAGYLIGEHENGSIAVHPVSDVPTGPIRAGWRSGTVGELSDFAVEYRDVRSLVDPRPIAFSDRSPNAVPADFLTPFELQAPADFELGWAPQHEGVIEFVQRNGRSAVKIERAAGSTSLRTEIARPAGVTHMTWYLRLDDTIEAGAFSSGNIRLSISERVNGSLLVSHQQPLQRVVGGGVISGVVELDPTTTSVVVNIGTAAGVPLVVSHASLAWSDQPGFRPSRDGGGGAATQVETALLGFSLVPDSVPGRDPKGHTCTGLDRITRGSFAGCWLSGDDGRLRDNDGGSSPYVPAVHVITPDWRHILATFPMPYSNASVQGIAVDTSGSEDTFWVATAGDKKLRHFHLYGPDTGDEIAADVFDWDAAGFDSQPNGLAYDPHNAALIVGPFNGTTLRRIDTDPAASPRVSATTWTLSSGSADQFHYDAPRRNLFYTVGGNGSDGSVRVINLDTGSDTVAYGNLPRVQAIEGIYIDRAAAIMTLTSDGGFHVAAEPELNIALQYRVGLIG